MPRTVKMSRNAFVGIDPGKSGGIAVISPDGVVLSTTPMLDLFELVEAVEGLNAAMRPYAALELVYSSPQMGVASAFTFGRGFGRLEASLTAAAIPYSLVTPGEWQRAMRCTQPPKRAGGKIGTKDKNITKRAAQRLFPKYAITHAIADALLLAEYCRRQILQGKW